MPAAASASGSRRALFLDRDGVINVDSGYVHRPEQTVFVDGIFRLAAQAQALGLLLVVVTNQAGIARGYYSEAQFHDFTHWLEGEFANRGTPLHKTYYCPYHPTHGQGEYLLDSPLRKPHPGMLLQAANDLDIALTRSFLVGDKASDILAARRASLQAAFLLSSDSQERQLAAADFACTTLDEVAKHLGRLCQEVSRESV